MTAQKYETYVGPAAEYPEPGVSYLDPATARLLAEDGITPVISASGHVLFPSNAEYLKLVARHPLEMSASYARHVFNGLDVKYPTPYVRDLRDTSTAALAARVHADLPRARAAARCPTLGGRSAACAGRACSCSSPRASACSQVQAEARYFLPLQLPIYLLACFGPATRATLLGGRERRVALAAAYAVVRARLPHALVVDPAQLEHPIADGAAPSAVG